jgi:hypothetical protein
LIVTLHLSYKLIGTLHLSYYGIWLYHEYFFLEERKKNTSKRW